MDKNLSDFRERRQVLRARWDNSISMLKEYRCDLERAETRIIELREKIPELREKIAQRERMIEFSRIEYEREFGGERNLKKERIARLKDGLEKLTRELSRIELAEADKKLRKEIRRSKKKKKRR